jgi:hypothetical protein
MSLTMTRPEKSEAMTRLVYALRETVAKPARAGELNISECLNALGQATASVIAGAYGDKKNREVVLSAMPDLIRAYFPQWDKIYADHASTLTEAGSP